MGLRLAGVALLILLARGALADGPIYVASTAPFAASSSVAQHLRDWCGLPEEQIEELVEDAKEAGLPVEVNDEAAAAKRGRVLVIEITRAISGGASWFLRNKTVEIQGRLLNDGVEVASFSALRSDGGLSALHLNACGVLHRCQDTLGGDVVEWLKNPTKDAKLGEYAGR